MNLQKTAADAAHRLTATGAEETARAAARHARLGKTVLDTPAKTTGLTHALRTRRLLRKNT